MSNLEDRDTYVATHCEQVDIYEYDNDLFAILGTNVN